MSENFKQIAAMTEADLIGLRSSVIIFRNAFSTVGVALIFGMLMWPSALIIIAGSIIICFIGFLAVSADRILAAIRYGLAKYSSR